MKKLLTGWLCWLLILQSIQAQILQDDFSDGDFTNNPNWSGQYFVGGSGPGIGVNGYRVPTLSFVMPITYKLQSDAPSGGSGTRQNYLATPISPSLDMNAQDLEWNFEVITPSTLDSNDKVRVWLSANQNNLFDHRSSTTPNFTIEGYCLEIREEVRLYYIQGASTESQLLAGGAPTAGATHNFRVVRLIGGQWEVFMDGISIGATNDAQYDELHFFGVNYIFGASSRRDEFYFDDLTIGTFIDTQPPVTTGTNVLDATTLEVFFNEELDAVSAETLTHYTLNGSQNPTTATLDPATQQKVTLNFSAPFNFANSLVIANVADDSGNALASATENFIFDNQAPTITAVAGVPPAQLQITFSEPVVLPSATTPGNYNVNNGIGTGTAATFDAATNTIVYVDFPNNFTTGATYTLTVTNVTDTLSNAITSTTFTFNFQDNLAPIPLEAQVISQNAIDILFNEPLEQAAAETTSNYGISVPSFVPSAAVLDNANPRLVHLFFTDEFPEDTPIDLTISNLLDRASPPNAMPTPRTLSFVYDDERPDVCPMGCVIPLSANELEIVFDEPVDEITSEIINNYEIELPFNEFATSAVRDPLNPERVRVRFATSFPSEQTVEIRIRDVQDLAGNEMTTRTRNFIFDPNPPSVLRVIPFSPTQLKVVFSENMDNGTSQNPAFYNLSAGFGNPITAQQDALHLDEVVLTFGASINDQASLDLTVEFPQDFQGNPLTPAQTLTFSTLAPSIAEVFPIGVNTVQLQFSEDVDASALNPVNYTIPGIGTAASVTVVSPSIRRITFSNDFTQNTAYDISVTNISDLVGNTLVSATEGFFYRTKVLAVGAVGANLVDVVFIEDVDNASAADPNKFSVDSGFGSAVAATVDGSDERIVHLAFDSTFAPATDYILTAAIGGITLQNGDFAPASEHLFALDNAAPQVVEIIVLELDEILVIFDEPVNEVTAEALNHYAISSGIGQPEDATLNRSNPREVTLELSTPLQFGTAYSLTVSNIRDLLGNELTSQNIAIPLPTPPNSGDLIITEIFADPTPQQGLPDEEFLEIYNNSNRTIDLFGVIIQRGSSFTNLDSYDLPPEQYLVLTQDAPRYDSLGVNVLDVSSIALANGGTTLKILAQDSTLINEITYDDAWHEPTKQDGGWSLEIVDITSPCRNELNWLSSVDTLGGTPGRVNSVNGLEVTAEPPRLETVEVITADTLRVVFDQEPDSAALVSASNYTVAGANIGQAVYQNSREVWLQFGAPLDPAEVYTLITQNISNCLGIAENDTARFAIGTTPPPFGVLITEIMADEDPPVGLPDAEYIELYNRSGQLVNLATLELEDGSNRIPLPNTFLDAGEYLTLTRTTRADSFSVRAVGVPSFPGLANTGEPLTLWDTTGTLIFAIDYDDDWYGDPAKADGGWSLEMIDPNNPCGEADNWRASEDPSGGTPSAQNSVFGENPDTENPEIAEFEIIGDSAARVAFTEVLERTSMLNPANYSVSGGLGIERVEYVSPKEVRVIFTNLVQENVLYTFRVVGATDCVNQAISDSREFGRGREPITGELVITEIMADPTPQVGLPDAEYLEIYNTTDDLIGLEKVKLSDGTNTITLPEFALPPGAYWVLTSTSNADELRTITPDVLPVPSFPGLSNGGERLVLENTSGQILQTVNYSDEWYGDPLKEAGGWSLEMIDLTNLCGEAENWRASVDSTGGTPARQNSIFGENPDTDAPEVRGVSLTGDSVLTVTFSEKMDTLDLQDPNFYTLNNGLGIAEVILLSDREVRLLLSPRAEPEVFYDLRVQGIRDCAGNELAPFVFTFGSGVSAGANEVVITEIFADPTPSVGLPESEYLEIYNRSERVISLNNLKLVDEGGETQLPNEILSPDEYLILCSASAQAELSEFGRAVAVSGFPSLTNGGEHLELRGLDGILIFSVDYDDDWYDDEVKDDGGWSLESIDPDNPCGENNNWTASRNSSGGTPGQQNSVFGSNPDDTAPEAERVNVLGNDRLQLVFNEKMDVPSLQNGSYTITNGIGIDSVAVTDERTILLLLTAPLDASLEYRLTISGMSDCSGNLLSEQTLTFGIGATAGYNELLITEILPDPAPVVGLPEAEFVEIFNPTEKIIGLGSLILSDATGETQPPAQTISPGEYLILTTSSAADDYARFGRTLAVSGMPSLNNSGETLSLRTLDSTLVFSLTYSDEWYRDIEAEDGGVSLEMIDTANPCGESENWRASEATAGGTPGAENSIAGTRPDNRPPELEKAFVENPQTVRLQFNEKLNLTQLENFATFEIDNGITVAAREIISEKEVRLRLNQRLENRVVYTISVGNATDCLGNLIGENNTATFVLPETGEVGDLIINELLFNPPVGGTDFVEIYNRSQKFINLQNWQWASWRDGAVYTPKTISEEVLILEPGEYYAFNEENGELLSQYPNGRQERFVEMDLPSYSDSEGAVLLLNPADSVFDRFDYVDDLQFGLLPDKEGVSLERISFEGETNDPNNWQSAAATAGYGTPGYLNSQHLENPQSQQLSDCFSLTHEVFSPDGDGFRDFTQINYECPATGQVVTISIYDVRGRKIRTLVQNQTLAVSGSLTWDGIREDGEKAKVGYYLILIELYDLDGNTRTIQKKVAVGARF